MNIDANQVLTDVTAKVLEDAALSLWSRIKQFFKETNAHDEINLGYAYEEYLRNTKNKNSKIKTLIYRHIPKDLYSFYECVAVECEGNIIDTGSILNMTKINNKIIITGTGGIGKSTLLKHLFLNTIEKTSYIPVLIELRTINSLDSNQIDIRRIVYENLTNNGFRMEEKYFEYSMEEGAYVILLDGFDEINKENVQKITTEIRNLGDKYPKNKYILTSRPTEGFVGWNDYVEMESMALTKEQALSLIDKIEFDENVKKTFYRELENSLYDKYRSFASNPLLLTIMLLTFDSRASIPDRLNDFYEQAFATLFNMHDATKEAYVRDIRTGLGCEDFKMVFAYFCFKTYFDNVFEFTEALLRDYLQMCKNKFSNVNFQVDDFLTDLVQSVCMLVKEGMNYRFSHRSFQEYFAAWYTCKLVDKVQYELVTGWIKESDAIRTDSYFDMLFNLQSEKVNKIILYPALKRFKKRYENEGFSVELLKYLFYGVGVTKRRNPKDGRKFILSLHIKNKFMCNILIKTCELNGYLYPELDHIAEQRVAEVIYKIRHTNYISFNRVIKVVEEGELLEAFEWFRQQILFVVNFTDKLEIETKEVRNNVKDILKSL